MPRSGNSYLILGETSLARENTRKAYELRGNVSEREQFYIESHYYEIVTGDLEKARQVYEFWAQTYPRDFIPPRGMGLIYEQVGQYDKALVEHLKSLCLRPDARQYANLAGCYLDLSRLQEAQATTDEAQAKELDSPDLRFVIYALAFLQNNTAEMAEMAQQAAWSAGKPGIEEELLSMEADTAAYRGRLRDAREFSRRAMESAERAGDKEAAATYSAMAGQREALFGNAAEARRQVGSALGLSTARDVQYPWALVLALVGDAVRARSLADDLGKRFPEDTLVRFVYLPTLHAQILLNRNDSSKAIEILRVAIPYELGAASLYPAYQRGEAYLAAHQGNEGAAEFQKVLDHRGIVLNEPIGALAHFQIGRAYAMQGDTAKAKAAYQDFLTLWKNADPDIPILKEAKAEYAKLQ